MTQFCAKVQKDENFPEKSALSLLSIYEPLIPCKISEKTNEPILRKVRHRHRCTDGPEFIGPIRPKSGVQYIKSVTSSTGYDHREVSVFGQISVKNNQ